MEAVNPQDVVYIFNKIEAKKARICSIKDNIDSSMFNDLNLSNSMD
jgi:hypothetical protein